MPSESVKSYLTVQFAEDEHRRLQARIVPLKNGSHLSQPCGLFLHKKAAKRALAEWVQMQGFWAIAVVALLLVEMVVTVADFLEEDKSRKLPPLMTMRRSGGCRRRLPAARPNW